MNPATRPALAIHAAQPLNNAHHNKLRKRVRGARFCVSLLALARRGEDKMASSPSGDRTKKTQGIRIDSSLISTG